MDIISQKWNDILETVKEEHELTEISFKTWLQPLEVFHVDHQKHIVTILVPSEQMGVDYINKKYMFPIKVAIAEIVGTEYDIEFILPDQASERNLKTTSSEATFKTALEQANLNPKYTFDTFVVGNNNKFAHAASLAVAETPGKTYNPLFIYGGAGLGKTHLMHSIAHFILKQNPYMKVLYVSSEQFTNELIDAIRAGNTNNSLISSFREKYRNVDVLLIDDIQFIIGKEATQEEFFHTFNDLHGKKKQIILTSDKPPKEIETLEARMRSRFEWGILADIGAPDYETRVAILHKKEETEGHVIDPKVIEYIASNIKSNIRELEGALNKLIAMQRLEHVQIDLEMAEKELRDMIAPDHKRIVTPQLIIETVAEHYHISPQDIISSKRSSNISYPRQIAMYLCKYMIDTSMTDIGIYMGGRDHSTVIHGVKKIESEVEDSETLRNTIDIIKKKVNPNL